MRIHDKFQYAGSVARVRRARLLLCVTLALLAGSAAALEPCKPFEGGRVDERLLQVMRDAAREGRLFRVLPGDSRVGFCVRHFPLREYRGEFTNIVGGLTLPPAMNEFGQALLLIHTTDMESSDPELDPLVQGHGFMDSKRFPEILFVGRAFQWYTPLRGYIYGDLTLHGRTQPVVFEVEIKVLESDAEGQLKKIYLHGTSQVNRLQFDMYSHRMVVSETVQLCLSVELALWEQ